MMYFRLKSTIITHTLTYNNNIGIENQIVTLRFKSYKKIIIKKKKTKTKNVKGKIFLMGMPPIVQEIVISNLRVYSLPLT